MDTSELIRKLKAAVPGAVLNSQPLGRKGPTTAWIEMKSILRVAQHLSASMNGAMDWLENLTAMDIEGALVLSYFVRSTSSDAQLVLRASVLPKDAETEAETASVVPVWPMAASFEREAAELFGIRFDPGHPERGAKASENRILPSNWIGFPLRKSYIFPSEFSDILHMRSVGHTEPDEHGVSQ